MERKAFMDEDFLLDTQDAKTLYHKYAENMPIIDYHCHIDPREIAEDKQYTSITELWLGGDHYKWRLMRQCGFGEELVTGNADDRERFRAWAATLEQAVGSPLYHWSHLELQRYFDCRLPINRANADEIYDKCNEVLKSGKLTARSIIEQSKVKVVGTTDDPCDSLEWHKKLAEDKSFDCKVIPTFRPDKVLLIEGCEFCKSFRRLFKIETVQVEVIRKCNCDCMNSEETAVALTGTGTAFSSIRMEGEKLARAYYLEKYGYQDITLQEIYAYISRAYQLADRAADSFPMPSSKSARSPLRKKAWYLNLLPKHRIRTR